MNFPDPCSHEKGDTGAKLGLTDDCRDMMPDPSPVMLGEMHLYLYH